MSELRKQPEWISVEDRLPDFGVEVICLWDEFDGGIAIGTLDEARFIHTKDGVQYYRDWTLYTSIGRMEYNVTHWMPMPEKLKIT